MGFIGKTKLDKVINISFGVWLLGIISVVLYIIAINLNEILFESWIFAVILLLIIATSSLSFFVASLLYIIRSLRSRNKNTSKRKKIFLLFKAIFMMAFLPFVFFVDLLSPKKNFNSIRRNGLIAWLRRFSWKRSLFKISSLILILGVVLPVWVGGYFAAVLVPASQFGLLSTPIPLSGTGSMYPTFPKGVGEDPMELGKQIVASPGMIPYPNGINVFGMNLFGHEIGRGDIIVFTNEKVREITKETYGEENGYVKRVVGLPNDTIEIRDGIFYLNNIPQKEPYIASARSTFGGEFLKECSVMTVPAKSLFVMGDNRKGSGDSRHEVGFINYDDVEYVLPWKKQKGSVDEFWRNPMKDLEEDSKIKLDKTDYLRLLNEERRLAGVSPLEYDTKLEESARLRGEVILEYNDFSFEATRSGYTMLDAMSDAGYRNTTWGEAPGQGYYEAEELLEFQMVFPQSKEFMLQGEFSDIGISEVEGEINGCPAQVVIQHLAGYVPPNYSQEDIDSWREALTGLNNIRSGWAELKNTGKFYDDNKTDIDRINQIIDLRIGSLNQIVSRMEKNEWLSPDERRLADQDLSLYEEQDKLAEKLNNL